MSNDPVVVVSWYGAVAFCNWLSQQEGYEACYDLSTWEYDFTKQGYRLPTEAEWEHAARGGEQSPYYRFPWGDTISHSQANYFSDSSYSYDVSQTRGFHPAYNDGIHPYTAPVGSFPANANGLYDITGNVSEWCWDWYDADWYSNADSRLMNTKGPDVGTLFGDPLRRIARGGNYTSYSEVDRQWGNSLRIAYREAHLPTLGSRMRGIRCVRGNVDDPLWVTATKWKHFPNWYYLDWFGHYYQSQVTWVFHGDFGLIYPNGNGSYDNWLYFPQHGWLWTNRYSFPFFYSSADSNWYEYDLLHPELGWFERYSDRARFRWGRAFNR